ncbi:hypothetical protein BDZ45DRAFT_798055 [Acephala macrosclerotiorum]|nr:hypothetical protein BDZ45DRAFT_798055 [Acephala macrosclerotiorum]
MPMMRARDDDDDGNRFSKRQRLEGTPRSSRDSEDFAWCCGQRLCTCTRANPCPRSSQSARRPNVGCLNRPPPDLRQLDDSVPNDIQSSPRSPPPSSSSSSDDDEEDDDDEPATNYFDPTLLGGGSYKPNSDVVRLPLEHFDNIGLPRPPHVPLALPFPSSGPFLHLKYRSDFEQDLAFITHWEEEQESIFAKRDMYDRRKRNEEAAEASDVFQTYSGIGDFDPPNCPRFYMPFHPKTSDEEKRIATCTKLGRSFLSQAQNDRRKFVSWFEDEDHPLYQERMSATNIWKKAKEAQRSRWSGDVLFVKNPFQPDITAQRVFNAIRHAKAPRHRRWAVRAGFESKLSTALFENENKAEREEGTLESEKFVNEGSDEDEDEDPPQGAGELGFDIGTAE